MKTSTPLDWIAPLQQVPWVDLLSLCCNLSAIKHAKIYFPVLQLEWVQMEMLEMQEITFNIRKNFFTVRVVRPWNRLSRAVV